MKKTIATLSGQHATIKCCGQLVLTHDPAPKAFEYIIEKFEAENPDVTVEWNLFDHATVGNTNPPDVANWY